MILALLSCVPDDPDEGTAVGNPTGMTAQTAAGADVSFSEAGARVDAVDLSDCEGTITTVEVAADVDLLGGALATIPQGRWCGVGLRFGGDITLHGSGAGIPMEVRLAIPTLSLSSTGHQTDGEQWILELGSPGWVSAAAIGDDGLLGTDSPEYASVAAAFVAGTRIVVDDGDGLVSDAERADAIFVATTDDGDGTDTDGTDTSGAHTDTGADSGEADSGGTDTGGTVTSGRDTAGAESGADTGGDSEADSGGSDADSGGSDSGDSDADSGDSDSGGSDSGDSEADSGDADSGDADSGDSEADSGDSEADSEADSGDSEADSGDSEADERSARTGTG